MVASFVDRKLLWCSVVRGIVAKHYLFTLSVGVDTSLLPSRLV
jgi:hypothetical protein